MYGTRVLFPIWLSMLVATPGALAERDRSLLENGSFETPAARTPPGWRGSFDDRCRLDDTVAIDGERSLRMARPGGMTTELVTYTGGRVLASGWVKTDSVERGEQPWHKAAIQVISYNADRKPVGHTDLALVDGTQDWTHYEGDVIYSRSVAFVAVQCHIWGPRTTGTAWFDDVKLALPDDPKTLGRKPLDLDTATVTVDFGRDLGEFRHLWLGSDVGWMDRVLTPTQMNAMNEVRKLGFRFVRLHDCIYNPRVYSENDAGEPVYGWDTFDRRISAVTDRGMWPIVVLETMPVELAGRKGPKAWTNAFPPKDPAAYLKWQQLNHDLVKHCRDKWGADIHNWYFEVWNEPNASGYFTGTLEDYLKIYDHAVAGATAADPGIRIGGPGSASTGWTRELLEHCDSGVNDATGGKGTRIDFLSWHIYTIGSGIPAFDYLRVSLDTIRRHTAEFPRYRDIPTLITEWGCSSGLYHGHDRPYDAAFRTMAVHAFMDYNITLAPPFCLGDGPHHAHDGFRGDLSMLTKTTIPKPNFRAWQLLGRMRGRRVRCESSNDPVGGLACAAPKRTRFWIMLYNLVEDSEHDPFETTVEIRLKGLPAGLWRCAATAVAPGECDPYMRWAEMGEPKKLTDAQRAELIEVSRLPAPRILPIADGRVIVAMPGFSVMLLELSGESD